MTLTPKHTSTKQLAPLKVGRHRNLPVNMFKTSHKPHQIDCQQRAKADRTTKKPRWKKLRDRRPNELEGLGDSSATKRVADWRDLKP